MDNLLNEVLKTEPQFSLPDNFADRVAGKVAKRLALAQYLKEFFIYLAAIVVLLAVAIATIFFFTTNSWLTLVEILTGNLVQVISILLLLLFILFADKVLLRYFHQRLQVKRPS